MPSNATWLIGGLIAAEATGVTNFTGSGNDGSGPQIPEIDVSAPSGGLGPEAIAALANARQSAPTVIESGGGLDASTVREIVDRNAPDGSNGPDFEWPSIPDGSGNSDDAPNPDADTPETDDAGGFHLQDLANDSEGMQPGDWLAAGGEAGAASGSFVNDTVETGATAANTWAQAGNALLGREYTTEDTFYGEVTGDTNRKRLWGGNDSGESNTDADRPENDNSSGPSGPLGGFGVHKMESDGSNKDADSDPSSDTSGDGSGETKTPKLSQSPTGPMIDKLDRLTNQ